jgi:hypothetical protein
MMWDLYTGGTAQAYPGLSKDDVGRRVAAGARPEFPPGAPPGYERLARDCWAADPAARPTMGAVVHRLQELLAGAEAAAPPSLGRRSGAAPLARSGGLADHFA